MADWDVDTVEPIQDDWTVVDHQADKSPQSASPAALAFLNGMSLGFGPQVNRAMVQGQFPDLDPAELDKSEASEKAKLATFSQEHPVESGLATTAGSALSTAPLLGLAGAGEQALLRGVPAAAKFIEGTAEGALRLPSLLTAGAKTGAEAAVIGSNLSDAPLPEQAGLGAVAGAGGNLLAPAIRKIGSLGISVNPLVQAAADKARSLGINIDTTKLADYLPKWLRGAGHDTEVLENYTRGLSHTIGLDKPSLTGDDLLAARDAISAGYKAVEPKLNISPSDSELKQSLAGILQDADVNWQKDNPNWKDVNHAVTSIQKDLAAADARTVPPTQIPPNSGTPSPMVGNELPAPGTVEGEFTVGDRPGAAGGTFGGMEGGIPGARYMAWTKRGGLIDQLMKNSGTRDLGVRLRDSVDDAVERGSAPDTLDQLRSLRSQWRNSQMLESLVEKASPHGIIDPTLVPGALRNSTSLYGWTHAGDMKTLADIGPLLSKSTAQGVAAHPHLSIGTSIFLGGSAVEALTGLLHDPKAAALLAASGVGTLASKKALQGYINSDLFRSVLENPNRPIPNILAPVAPQLTNQISAPVQ